MSSGAPYFPTTPGAYDETFNGGLDAFVSRLDMLPTGVRKYGTSTPSCVGPMAMGVTKMPQPNTPDFTILGINAPPNATGYLLLGREPADRQQSGVRILVRNLYTPPIPIQADATGTVSYARLIPAGTEGRRFYAQFVMSSDRGCGLPNPSYSASNALEVTVTSETPRAPDDCFPGSPGGPSGGPF